MSTKITVKINQFYLVLIGVGLVLAVVVVVVIRSIFGSLNKASEVDQSLLDSQNPRINKQQLDQATEFLNNRQFELLDLR